MIKMKRFHLEKFLHVLCYGIILTSSSIQGAMFTHDIRPFIAIGTGISSSTDSFSSTQFIEMPVNNNEYYNYVEDHSRQNTPFLNGFAGIEWEAHDNKTYQLGISYQQLTHFNRDSQFTQGVDAQSTDLYHYHYSVLTKQLLIAGKILLTMKEHYHPYFLAGIGAAHNHAYHYTTDVPPLLTFTRLYQDNTTNSFSYLLRIGIDTDITSNVRLGIGYQFTDYGKIKLGNAEIDTTSVQGTLSQTHFYANELIAQLSYLFA